MNHFEMASSNNTEEIVMATQRSFVAMLRDIISGAKNGTDAPGLTWEQLDYLLDESAKKRPTIIQQSEEM